MMIHLTGLTRDAVFKTRLLEQRKLAQGVFDISHRSDESPCLYYNSW
jgi:hypothetical protein